MKTILVVDDDERIGRLLVLMLRRKGFHVIKVNDAMVAHEFLREGRKVDLVLLDINMPEVPGDAFCEVLQAFHYRTRVIVCSVLPVEEQTKRIPHAMDYYDKSENFSVLMHKIDMVFKNGMVYKKILIIDNDPQIRLLYRRVLMAAGYYPIDTADSLEIFRFLKKQIRDVDLVLLDIAMPRISGIEFYEMIKKEYPQAKVMISSVFSEEQQRVFISQADDYFDKSESNKVLLEKVKRLV